MSEKLEIFKCDACKKTIQVLLDGAGELVCCNKPMIKMIAHAGNEMKNEYHIPVTIATDNNEFIQVGKELHPMSQEHHIELIQVISECGKKIMLHYLSEDDEPKIKMYCDDFGQYKMREICNIHGLWEGYKN